MIPALRSRDTRALREHFFEILYGLGSVVYVILMAASSMFFFHAFLGKFLAGWLPFCVTESLAWMMGAAVVVLSAVAVLGDLKKTRGS